MNGAEQFSSPVLPLSCSYLYSSDSFSCLVKSVFHSFKKRVFFFFSSCACVVSATRS